MYNVYFPTIVQVPFIADHVGQWKSSKSQLVVDFSDFPNFDQNSGEPGDTIVWVLKPTGPILFTINPEFSSVNHYTFFPICSVTIIKHGWY